MKRYLIRSIIFVIAVIIIILLQGRTKGIDITFPEGIKSFNQYEMAVNEFMENPTDEKVANVTKYGIEFSTHYYDLIYHQTLYNKLLRVEPILTNEEIVHLEDLYRTFQKLDENYVSTALTNVFKAYDFSILLDEAKEKGEHKTMSIDIHYSGDNHFNILIDGTLYLDGSPNILTRYFIIETEEGNYYLEKPSNFSMTYTHTEVSIRVDKTKYDIKGNIEY
ncbi:hypothetical protein N0O92_20570 [Alkalihalobacillus sp. MEB130]|uniref:hypothetical protein n=1 Tax=Alkalihalobacillus sp. MEB130 TaxID=2976704 RepID=UPI0028DDAE9E|nr:hypothetical protein [Alkalihalobacillus sp. MEB130]MDT8862598.1 hypothetical protein [Alkalihalobacillus sp. MEB130]